MDGSNQLLKVADSGDKNRGFVDGINTDNDYGYDANGNMLFDQNKGITTTLGNIRYNHLNLPEYVNRGGNTIRYIYDATGRKLAQDVVYMGVGDKRTDYSGEFEYENDVMKSVSTGEGRIVVGTQKEIYTNPCEDVSTVTNVNSKVITITDNGEKYFRVTATGTSAGTGLFPIGETIRVQNGERYLIRAKGYQSTGSVSYIHAKVNGNNVSYPYVSIPNRDGTESWSEQIITIPGGAADTTLQVGVTWPTTNTSQIYYLNEFEVIKLESQDAEYQYHLKDHLGNVRITFTTKDEVESKTATMEAAQALVDDANFQRYGLARKVRSSLFDHTRNGQLDSIGYAQRLNGSSNERIGLAKSLSVMPGDIVNAEVYAKYVDPEDDNWQAALETLLGYVASGSGPSGTVIDGSGYSTSGSTPLSITPIGHAGESEGDVPKAYLNYFFINRNFDISSVKPLFARITEAGKEDGSDGPHEYLTLRDTIAEAGYVYVYLSNDGEDVWEVYFDDFKVEHVKSPVIQSEDFYPFGLTFNSYNRENNLHNQYQYNKGSERQDELDLNVDFTRFRMYDPAMGRWWQMDPLSNQDALVSFTPYNYSFNNPIRYNDPEGDFPGIDGEAFLGGVWNAVKDVGSFVAETVQTGGQNVVDGAKNAAAFAELAHAAPGYAGDLVTTAAKSSFIEGIKETGSPTGAASKMLGEVTGGILLGAAGDKGLSKLGAIGKVLGKADNLIPDNTPVIRGGTCTCAQFEGGSGVNVVDGKLTGVSVNSKAGLTVEDLSQGIPNNKVGTTTVGQVRGQGGNVVSSPTNKNPNHATLSGITGKQAEQLFSPVIPNPAKKTP